MHMIQVLFIFDHAHVEMVSDESYTCRNNLGKVTCSWSRYAACFIHVLLTS